MNDGSLKRVQEVSPGREGSTMKSDKRKQSLYFPEDMLEEIKREANRQDRSLSWIVQRAWTIARNEIQRFPSVNDPSPDDEEDREELG